MYETNNLNSQNIITESDNTLDDSNQKIKKTRNRLTKKQQYSKEREEIINKLNQIIGIDDKKNSVYLYDLEHNEEIKKKINNLKSDIAKYHKCGMWGYFSNDIKKGKGNEIGLLRAVYKDNDILITTKNKIIERNNIKINSTVYYFNKIKS